MTRWEVTKAVRASELPAPSRLIMLTLADIAKVGTAEIPEHFTPSLTVLAKETGLGRSTIAAHLNELEADGWVGRTRPDNSDALHQFERTRYRLMVPESDRPAEGLGSPDAGPRSPGQGLPVVQEVDHPSPGAGHRDRSSSDLDLISSDLNPSSTTKDVAIPEREDVELVCKHLADRIEANGSKRPTVTKKWRTEARLLIDKDGRTVEQVMRAIDWCQEDVFWKGNILSMPKLREKYDTLRLAAQRTNGHKPSTTDQRVADGLALAARLDAQEGR